VLARSRAWQRIDDLVGIGRVRHDLGSLLVQLAEDRALGTRANVVLTGLPGSGRREIARLYAQALSEMDLVPSGHLVRASISTEFAGQWPGQVGSLVGNALGEARGGTLLVDCDREDLSDEVAEALSGLLRREPAAPPVILVGEPGLIAALFAGPGDLRACFGQHWAMPEYDTGNLAEIAVRYLVRRGHEVPDEVRAAFTQLVDALPDRTVRGAHTLAAGIARTAASRTLTTADIGFRRDPTRLGGGLASVG
jgi:hypothetical protein